MDPIGAVMMIAITARVTISFPQPTIYAGALRLIAMSYISLPMAACTVALGSHETDTNSLSFLLKGLGFTPPTAI